jgi:hypothetical protein
MRTLPRQIQTAAMHHSLVVALWWIVAYLLLLYVIFKSGSGGRASMYPGSD